MDDVIDLLSPCRPGLGLEEPGAWQLSYDVRASLSQITAEFVDMD